MRFMLAVLIGLALSVLIWVFSPYTAYLLNTGHLTDSYLPVLVLFLMLVLLLVLNPLLGLLGRRWMLNRMQLATIFGILLVACVTPGHGLLRMLPYSIARIPVEAKDDARLAEVHKKADIPEVLFPEPIGADEVPAASQFRNKLENPEDNLTWNNWWDQIKHSPWVNWWDPLWSWGLALGAIWLMAIGLALIVVPQWRRNERLAFPLLVLEQSLLEEPRPGEKVAPLFKRKGFWIAAGTVFCLYLLHGFHKYSPEAVPAIPLDFNLQALFTEGIFKNMPLHVSTGSFYFIFIGVAFFMSTRVSFSIWFFVLIYALYLIFGMAYMQPFSKYTSVDHRNGAMFALTIAVLWLGRRHWAQVARSMLRIPARSDAEARDRNAGWMFLLGCAGLYVWLVDLAGVQWYWAAYFVIFAFFTSVLITRLVAETGLPFVRLDTGFQVPLLKTVGAHLAKAKALWLLSPASLYFSSVMAMLFSLGSRVSATTMVAHAVCLDDRGGPRRQFRFGTLLLVVLLLSVVVAGGVHLYINYNYGATLDNMISPINDYGSLSLLYPGRDLQQYYDNNVSVRMFNEPDRADFGFGHFAFGVVAAGVLFWLCQRSPVWPLHPIGLVIVDTYYSGIIWPSVFIGWMAKVMILRYGGAALYRAARPVILGLIVGEVLAAVFWGIEPAVREWLGEVYVAVYAQPK